MTTLLVQTDPIRTVGAIAWKKPPEDFLLPDGPVESTLQPLLAAALRECLELAGLILESCLIASNFGICSNVNCLESEKYQKILPDVNNHYGLEEVDLFLGIWQGKKAKMLAF